MRREWLVGGLAIAFLGVIVQPIAADFVGDIVGAGIPALLVVIGLVLVARA